MMRFELILVGLTFTIGIISTVIFLVTIRFRRKFHGYWGVPLLFLLNAFYALGYGFELASDSIQFKIIFNHVQNIGIPFIAMIWLLIAQRFTQRTKKISLKIILINLAIPLLLFVTSQLHYFTNLNWYYSTYELVEVNFLGSSMTVLLLGKSFVYYLGQAYYAVAIIIVTYLYTNRALKVSGIQRNYSIVLASCSILSLFLVLSSFFSSKTSAIDYSLYILSAIGYVIFYSIYHYELFTLKPLANQSLFFESNSPIMIFDDKFDLVEWNKQVKILNFVTPKYQYHIDNVISNADLVESIKLVRPFSFDIEDKHYVVEVLELKGKDSRSIGYVIHFLEMSIFVDRLNKLDYMATHDSLTNTYNRSAFNDKVNHFISNNNNIDLSFALFIYDFDDFKLVNDQYGHLAGDRVLIEVSDLIMKNLPSEAVFCRFGGEEFIIFIPNIDFDSTKNLADNLCEMVRDYKVEYQSFVIQSQISVGVLHSKVASNMQIDSMIDIADKALYQSKRTGKNKVTIF